MVEFKSQKIKSVIKDLLKKKGIKYEDLAEEMECSVPTIKRILGPEELTLNRLLQLCEILNVELADLEVLTKDVSKKAETFTAAQEDFLVKNPHFFAYLMKLLSGETPKQIAELNGLTQKSTDKYLIGLEKNELIRVTGGQKVKPIFTSSPTLGDRLGALFKSSMIKNSSQFFENIISEAIGEKNLKKEERTSASFSVMAAKISKVSYETWRKDLIKVLENFENIAAFEERTKDPSELMTAVFIHGNTIVPTNHKGLQLIENTFGGVKNL